MILTIDLGNSTLSWILYDKDRVAARRTAEVGGSLPDDLFEEIETPQIRSRLKRIVAASVVPPLDERLKELCRERLLRIPRFIDYRNAGELTLAVDHPAELGADRIAACLGALQLCPTPLIVIDSGTATTFDLVDEMNVYIGSHRPRVESDDQKPVPEYGQAERDLLLGTEGSGGPEHNGSYPGGCVPPFLRWNRASDP